METCATACMYLCVICSKKGVGPIADKDLQLGGQIPGQGDKVPLKLTTYSYFRDYFLNKIITKIWEN